MWIKMHDNLEPQYSYSYYRDAICLYSKLDPVRKERKEINIKSVASSSVDMRLSACVRNIETLE